MLPNLQGRSKLPWRKTGYLPGAGESDLSDTTCSVGSAVIRASSETSVSGVFVAVASAIFAKPARKVGEATSTSAGAGLIRQRTDTALVACACSVFFALTDDPVKQRSGALNSRRRSIFRFALANHGGM